MIKLSLCSLYGRWIVHIDGNLTSFVTYLMAKAIAITPSQETLWP
jgi:hypothetical protein